MKRSTAWTVFYLLLVFVSGILVGGFGQRLYTVKSVSAKAPRSSHEDYRQRYLREMQTRLKLSPEQVERLVAVLDETRAGYRQIRGKYDPEMKALQEAQRNRIRAMLDGAQRAEYERMVVEKDRKEKSREKGRPSGGFGGPGC